MRASDEDRSKAAALLQAATADGRVSVNELDTRLATVYQATTRDELDSVVKDLQPVAVSGSPSATKDVGVISDFVRDGRWVVGPGYRGTAVVGSGVIDLRHAQFTGPETTIHVTAWVSTVYVVVPDDAEVRVQGTGVLGGFTLDRESAHPATRRITVTGTSVCSSVHVVHEIPPAKQRRLLKRRR
ncbi:DUF1707 domain-containing protein [Actinocrispum sp. NPDC049592]|uniref:DUF1707 domain-containing protein n=1 Tax=Actinocrispum sp. NPDC049592 TaxID=3154835 RepID=UPI003433B7B9